METLKVSGKSRPNAVAGAIAALLRSQGEVEVQAIGPAAVNQAVKAIAIARECRTILAAAGITLDYPVMRHANNLESVMTYEGTSEVHQLIVGQALTGEAAFR